MFKDMSQEDTSVLIMPACQILMRMSPHDSKAVTLRGSDMARVMVNAHGVSASGG